jgi:hypothetical protein
MSEIEIFRHQRVASVDCGLGEIIFATAVLTHRPITGSHTDATCYNSGRLINRKIKLLLGINVIQKLVLAFLFCTNVISLGQTSAKPLVLVKAGRLFDSRSGRFVQNQGILIEGDRIKEVGDAATLSSHAAGAKTIDLLIFRLKRSYRV